MFTSDIPDFLVKIDRVFLQTSSEVTQDTPGRQVLKELVKKHIAQKRQAGQKNDIKEAENFDECSTDHMGVNFIEPLSCQNSGKEYRLCTPGKRKANFCLTDSTVCVFCEEGTYMDSNNNCTVCKSCTQCGEDEEVVTPCNGLTSETACRPKSNPSGTEATTLPLIATTVVSSHKVSTQESPTTQNAETLPWTPFNSTTTVPTLPSKVVTPRSTPVIGRDVIVWKIVCFILIGLLVITVLSFIFYFKKTQGRHRYQPAGNQPPQPGCIDENPMVEVRGQQNNEDGDAPANAHAGVGVNHSVGVQNGTIIGGASIPSNQPALRQASQDDPVDDADEGEVGHHIPEAETPLSSFGPDNSLEPLLNDGRVETNAQQASTSGPRDVHRNRSNSSSSVVDLDQLNEVEPDGGGYYTQAIKRAWPTRDQMYDTDMNYNMAAKVKGLAFVLNNKSFPRHKVEMSKYRGGSEVDLANMTHIFEELGYIVEKHEDLTGQEILDRIREFSRKCNDPENKCRSAVIVLMSHGAKGVIHGTDLVHIPLKQIQQEFDARRCPYLKGKPKIFFYQACREVKTNQPDDANTGSAWSKPDENADFYFAYATTEGKLSLRDTKDGSWFVQALSEVFISRAHEDDIDKLMTRVNNRVTSYKGKYQGKLIQQTSEFRSCLTKTLHFLPKFPPDNPPWEN